MATESVETLSAAKPRRAWWAGPWPLAAFFFAWCLFFYTRHNTRPAFYEKDGPSKVEQVLSGTRNFFHPLLMVNTADALLRFSGWKRTEENANRAGHWAIAFFGAAAVAVFVLLGFHLGGWLGAFAVGVWLSLNEFLLHLAHYFKEDPALLMGLALSFLAMKLFRERPTLARAGWVGAACGVAIAGKYVGAGALILALPLVLLADGSSRARLARVGVLLGACLVVLLAIDWQWVVDFQALRTGVHTQMNDLLREEMMKKIPHTQEVRGYYRDNLPSFIVLGLLLQVACLLDCARCRMAGMVRGNLPERGAAGVFQRITRFVSCAISGWPVEWMMFIYCAIFTVVLLWTPRLFERHFLPVFICLWMSSALGWVNAARWIWQRFPKVQPAYSTVAVVAIIVWGGWKFQESFFGRLHSYKKDHRAMLAEWIRAHLPPDAVIAQDRRVFLTRPDGSPRPDFALPQRIVTVGVLSDLRELKALRKHGVTHVAMHRLDSGRFMPGGKLASKDEPISVKGRNRSERRAFYSDLEAHAHRVWGHQEGGKDDEEGTESGLLLYALDDE